MRIPAYLCDLETTVVARRRQRNVGDVTVREAGGRTVALCGVATEGNFSPKVAFSGTFATDPHTSSVGSQQETELCGSECHLVVEELLRGTVGKSAQSIGLQAETIKLNGVPGGGQTLGYVQFYGEAIHISIRGSCHLELHEGQPAAEYLQQSLGSLDQSNVRDVAFATVYLGMAHVQCKEIDEAARLFGDAGEIAARNSSAQLIERLKQVAPGWRPGSTLPPSANSTIA